MKNSSSGNSVYAFLPICYCHDGLDGHEVPLAFTTNKNADVAARTVMLYAMLNGMFGSE